MTGAEHSIPVATTNGMDRTPLRAPMTRRGRIVAPRGPSVDDPMGSSSPPTSGDSNLKRFTSRRREFPPTWQPTIRPRGPPDPVTHGGARGPRSRLFFAPALGLRLQRPNHLMARAARNRRVFFVEEPVEEDAPTAHLRLLD